MRIATLMRHGATTQPGRYHGHSEVPLSGQGMEDMHAALSGPVFDRVISSPLQRCARFAEDYAHQHDIPITLDSDWIEISFGEWEGMSAHEIMDTSPKALKAFWRDPIHHPPPGGEPLADASKRIQKAWTRLPDVPRTLIVTHGGVMRLLFCRLMGLPLSDIWRVELNYVARMEFAIDETGERLRSFDSGRA
ncbi:MAG: alpha-ribazole phosphatase family protein [Halothiobacillaceae bacterium]|nr:MAG: alpha-ribazole phosphatase family protein [Halothiobacillaceae bacterium]